MACITEGSTGYPGSNGAIPFANGFLSEMLTPFGCATFCVGKWHLTPAEQDMQPARTSAGRWDAASIASTASSAANPPVLSRPGLRQPPVKPPKTPEEGYHLNVDLADKANEFIADLKQVAPEGRSSSTSHRRQPCARTTPRRNGPKSTRGKFDDGWDDYREKAFARQKELGIVAEDAELSPPTPTSSVGRTSPTTKAGSTPA